MQFSKYLIFMNSNDSYCLIRYIVHMLSIITYYHKTRCQPRKEVIMMTTQTIFICGDHVMILYFNFRLFELYENSCLCI